LKREEKKETDVVSEETNEGENDHSDVSDGSSIIRTNKKKSRGHQKHHGISDNGNVSDKSKKIHKSAAKGDQINQAHQLQQQQQQQQRNTELTKKILDLCENLKQIQLASLNVENQKKLEDWIESFPLFA